MFGLVDFVAAAKAMVAEAAAVWRNFIFSDEKRNNGNAGDLSKWLVQINSSQVHVCRRPSRDLYRRGISLNS